MLVCVVVDGVVGGGFGGGGIGVGARCWWCWSCLLLVVVVGIVAVIARFGTCRAEICRDHVTGDSLNYAFVEFEAIESCEEVSGRKGAANHKKENER